MSPLIKSSSKKALSKNIEAEMKANPSPSKHKQNIAIAYSMQKQARKKKMAFGGELDLRDENKSSADSAMDEREMHMSKSHPAKVAGQEDQLTKQHMAGADDARDSREMAMMEHKERFLNSDADLRRERMEDADSAHTDRNEEMLHQPLDEPPSEEDVYAYAEGGSVVDAIRAKRKQKMFEDGGQVNLQQNGDVGLDEEELMDAEAAKGKAYFDDSQMEDQPMDSNEHGDMLQDEDEHGMSLVDKIRKKAKSAKAVG